MNHTKNEKVLVTGGGGFLGKAIVKQLKEGGDRVTSFSRSFYDDLDRLGVEQIQGDLADPEAVNRALRGVDTVFHVAAKPGIWGAFDGYFRANVTGTRNVINACRANRVARLVHTSSPSVVFDGNHMEGADESAPYPEQFHAPYPETKAMAEKLVIEAAADGVQAIILRPHLIWGPEDNHLVPGIIKRAGRLKQVGDGTNLVDTIYVDNAAHAHLLARDSLKRDPNLSGNTYFISQDDPVPLWEMVNSFLAAAGLPPVKGRVSARAAFLAGRFFESVYRLFGIQKEPPMTGFAAKELATAHWFDISRAKQDLGYVPVVSTREGLSRLRQWLNESEPQ
ncbi:MAG: NAD-dependent epimerase/dehydratase family protein [Desulfobacteraceae bacterium]|nr:NAD-dependent epimerase/dehydratase family protein [Desulfobacteraceae bacterium]